MGDGADDALDRLCDEDEFQINSSSRSSTVFSSERETLPHSCNICGALLKEKKGKFGPFLGCPNWPKCKGSHQISLLPKSPMEFVDDDGEV